VVTKSCTESERTRCGTVGCAIGHGPYAGIKKRRNETWTRYAERVFTNGWFYQPLYQFLFEGDWWQVDDTREGVVKRIHYALKYGVPDTKNYDVDGAASLQDFYHKSIQQNG
jgi:hypothetical protein